MPCSSPATWIPQMADRFVSMYVNERTLDYGPDGRKPCDACSTWATRPELSGAAQVEFV